MGKSKTCGPSGLAYVLGWLSACWLMATACTQTATIASLEVGEYPAGDTGGSTGAGPDTPPSLEGGLGYADSNGQILPPDAGNCGASRCVDCQGSSECQAVCAATEACVVDCRNGATCTNITCAAGAECIIDCRNGGDCRNVRCEPGASCQILCDADQGCSFAQCADGVMCAPGAAACNAACP